MNEQQRMAKEFHERFGIYIHDYPSIQIPKNVKDLRIALLQEEEQELEKAIHSDNLVGICDALGDLLYVIYGTCVSFGIDIEPFFAEIHRANMSKGDPTVIVAPDGKIIRAKNYSPPNLFPILKQQLPQQESSNIEIETT